MANSRIRRPDASAGAIPTDRKFVTALARGLQILGAFETEVGLGNQELAQRTGLPPATVTRLTYTLTLLGYLRLMPNGKYCTGAGFLGLSASVQRNLGVQRVARPYMEALVKELDCSVAMGTRDRNSMIFLDLVRPSRPGLTVNTDIGSALPIHNTAIGMAYLLAAPLAERAEILELLQEECRDDWDAVRQTIEQATENFKKDGFVTRIGSWHRDVNAVGVPLKVSWVQTVYSFICVDVSPKMSRRVLKEVYGPALCKMVADIKAKLEKERPARLSRSRQAS